ncbi:MAG: hypothetical protein R3F34_12455 [Planctomycetota bacterium]
MLLHGALSQAGGGVPPESFVAWSTRDGRNDICLVAADGAWTAGELEPGTYDLVARSSFAFARTVEVELVSGEGEHRVDLELDPMQRIRVHVADSDGAPTMPQVRELLGNRRGRWCSVHVVATREQPTGALLDLLPSVQEYYALGSFQPSGKTAPDDDVYGVLTVRRPEAVWISLVVAQQVAASQYVAREAEDVHFRLDVEDLLALRGGLRAEAVDARDGSPVAATFEFAPRLGRNDSRTETTGADGRLEVEELFPGVRELSVRADGYAEVRRTVTIPRGAVLELGRVELERPVEITGVTVDREGVAIRCDVRFGRRDLASGAIDWSPGGELRTTAEGVFTISGLAPGRYAVGIRDVVLDPATRKGVHLVSDLELVNATAGDARRRTPARRPRRRRGPRRGTERTVERRLRLRRRGQRGHERPRRPARTDDGAEADAGRVRTRRRARGRGDRAPRDRRGERGAGGRPHALTTSRGGRTATGSGSRSSRGAGRRSRIPAT